MSFEKRRIGRTTLEVTTLGLGTASLAGNMEAVSEGAALALVADAYGAGIRYFRHFAFYGVRQVRAPGRRRHPRP
ncbi:MAG: hypothetical protein WDM84_05015 [Bauldia sp.]